MPNWHKYRNYSRHKNEDGTFTYIVTIDSHNVEVSREVYTEYAKSARKMEYMEQDLKRDRIL